MKSVERRVSTDAAYGLYNFQREAQLQHLANTIQSSKGPSVAILSGPEGIGRSYLVHAAVHRLKWQDRKVQVLPIDLESFQPDEEDGLFRFLEHQIRHRAELKAKQKEEILSEMRPLLRFTDLATFGKASAISLSLNLKAPLKALRRFFQSSAEDVSMPRGSDRGFLHKVLEDLAGSGKLVITTETALLPTTFRRWLVEEAERDGSPIFLAIRAAPDAATEDVAPLAAQGVERIEIEPLALEELQELLALRFSPHKFPAELAETLHARTQGEPGHLAALTYDLVRRDALRTSEGTWHLPPESLESPEVIEALQADSYEPIEQHLGELEPSLANQAQQFLLYAALGGEIIPADLLFQHLGISGRNRDDIIDFLDDDLCEALGTLEDLDFTNGHRSFAGLGLLYRFTSPVVRRVVLNRVDAWGREDRAAQLLPFLKEKLPVRNREIARYFLSVCRHLDQKKQEPYLRELAWWVELDKLDELMAMLAEAIDEEQLDKEVLWLAAIDRSQRWHPRRRLMFLDLYGQYEIPQDHLSRWHRERARALLESGQYHLARNAAEQAISLEDRTRVVEFAITLATLGAAQHQAGALNLAAQSLSKAVQLFSHHLGSNHPLALSAKNNHALVLHALGQWAEAENLLRTIVQGKIDTVGVDNLSTLITQLNLASVLIERDSLEEAEHIYSTVLDSLTKKFPDHLELRFKATIEMSKLRRARGQLREAEHALLKVEKDITHSFGGTHPLGSIASHELAGTFRLQGRMEEAEKAYRGSIDTTTKNLGSTHPETLMAQHNLASLLQNSGRIEEAEELCERALRARSQSLGDTHFRTQETRKLLERIRAQLLQTPEEENGFEPS